MAASGRAPKAVLLTHNETSTGVTNPLAELAAAVRAAAPDALILVDGISGLGAVPFETDGVGPRRRRDRFAEELDGAARTGHGQRLAARLGSGRACDDASLLLRPEGSPRERRQGRDPVDPGGRRLLRAGRGARAHRGGGLRQHLRPTCRMRRRRASRASGDGRHAVRRSGPRLGHGHVGAASRTASSGPA